MIRNMLKDHQTCPILGTKSLFFSKKNIGFCTVCHLEYISIVRGSVGIRSSDSWSSDSGSSDRVSSDRGSSVDPLTEDPLPEDPLSEDTLLEDTLTVDPLVVDPLVVDSKIQKRKIYIIYCTLHPLISSFIFSYLLSLSLLPFIYFNLVQYLYHITTYLWALGESNPGPQDYEPPALPLVYRGWWCHNRFICSYYYGWLCIYIYIHPLTTSLHHRISSDSGSSVRGYPLRNARFKLSLQ